MGNFSEVNHLSILKLCVRPNPLNLVAQAERHTDKNP